MEFYEFDATLYAQFVDDSGGMKFSVIVRFVMDLCMEMILMFRKFRGSNGVSKENLIRFYVFMFEGSVGGNELREVNEVIEK